MQPKLRVWWIPQVPMKSFYVPVKDIFEAKLVLDTLARYDQFQFDNNVKPDYCNAGGLQIWDDRLDPDENNEHWTDWYVEDGGSYFDDLDEYIEYLNQKDNEK